MLCNSDLTTALISFSEHIDERKVCNAVSPDKDVDGFHVINVGRMCLDQCSMLPATPWGVWEIIKRTGRYLHLSIIKIYLRNGKNSYRTNSGTPPLRSSSPTPQSLTPLAIACNCFCCFIQETLKETEALIVVMVCIRITFCSFCFPSAFTMCSK